MFYQNQQSVNIYWMKFNTYLLEYYAQGSMLGITRNTKINPSLYSQVVYNPMDLISIKWIYGMSFNT